MITAEKALLLSNKKIAKTEKEAKRAEIKNIEYRINQSIKMGETSASIYQELYEETIEYFSSLGFRIERNKVSGSKIYDLTWSDKNFERC